MERSWLLVASAVCLATAAQAQPVSSDEEEQDLSRVFGDAEMVSIASGYRQPLVQAPSAATVITAADISAMGATDLDQVLATVPGLHLSLNGETYAPIYALRGIYSGNNPQILVMINGFPITDVYTGGRSLYWGGMSVQAISRVEVVRGPGSALYGADAAAGVINIVTKSGKDLNGTQLGLRFGSFDTFDGWVLHGGEWSGIAVTAAVEYHKTAGQKGIIDADQQTVFDQLYGTDASLAPGPVNTKRNNLDARLDLSRGDWRLRAGWQLRDHLGMGTGIFASALAPSSSYTDSRWNVDLTYHNPKVTEHWDLEAQVSYLDLASTHDSDILLFPRGTVLPIGANGQFDPGSSNLVLFPDGYIGNPDVFTRTARSSFSANFSGLPRNFLRMGGGFNYSTISVRESKNFGLDPATGLPINGTRVVDVTNTPQSFILGHPDRKNAFLFLQDEWKFARDWAVTGGVRYDFFSDFGHTVNPRAALVWEARFDFTTKLMYGRAFRAPAFWELYLVNAPFSYSNRKLKPEIMNTVEWAVDYRPLDGLHFSGSLFYYWWSGIIAFQTNVDETTSTARNLGGQMGYGGELVADWKALSTLQLTATYAYQNSIDDALHQDVGNAPHHQLFLRVIWEFLPDWQLSPQAKWIVDRRRPPGDDRRPIPDYLWVDLALRRRNALDHFDVALVVRNLLDVDAREPAPPALVRDLPREGRSFLVEGRFEF